MNIDIIKKYFSQLDSAALQQIEQLQDVYAYWNERINVISRKDIEYLYVRHVLHSLSIAKIVTFEPDSQVMDVGTGGGFPAVPLAILFPKTKFLAVDSIGKKIKVLENICKDLNLTNIDARHERVETINDKFDFVTGRAVTNLPDFFALVRKNIKSESKHVLPNGIICLKGGNLDEEIDNTVKKYSLSSKKIRKYEISDFFDEDFFETKKILYIQN